MSCIRHKMVWSGALNKMVKRCDRYDNSGLSFGAFKIPGVDFGQIKDTLITGGVAVGGAVITGKAVAYIVPMVKIDPASKWMPILEIGTGILLGVVVSKLTKKPDLGAALAIGPVVVNGLRLVSGILAPGNGLGRLRRPPVSTRQQLGTVIDQAAFPPEGTFDPRYSPQSAGWVAAA